MPADGAAAPAATVSPADVRAASDGDTVTRAGSAPHNGVPGVACFACSATVTAAGGVHSGRDGEASASFGQVKLPRGARPSGRRPGVSARVAAGATNSAGAPPRVGTTRARSTPARSTARGAPVTATVDSKVRSGDWGLPLHCSDWRAAASCTAVAADGNVATSDHSSAVSDDVDADGAGAANSGRAVGMIVSVAGGSVAAATVGIDGGAPASSDRRAGSTKSIDRLAARTPTAPPSCSARRAIPPGAMTAAAAVAARATAPADVLVAAPADVLVAAAGVAVTASVTRSGTRPLAAAATGTVRRRRVALDRRDQRVHRQRRRRLRRLDADEPLHELRQARGAGRTHRRLDRRDIGTLRRWQRARGD